MKILKLFLVGIVAILLGACFHSDEKIKPLSGEESEKVISFYYQNSDKQLLLRALATFDEPGVYNPNMKAPLMGFLAALASQRPQDWQLVRQMVFDNTEELNRMWASVERQQQALDKMLSQQNVIANSPAELDFLWGAFSATGDKRFVEIVKRTAEFAKVDPLVKAAAQWSLSSQRKEHPLVEQTLNKKEIEGVHSKTSQKLINVFGKSFKLTETNKQRNEYVFVRPDDSVEMFFVSELNTKNGENKQQVTAAYANYLKDNGEKVTQLGVKEKNLIALYYISRDQDTTYLYVSKFKDISSNKVLKNEYALPLSKQQDNAKYIQQIVNDFINLDMIRINGTLS